MSKDCNGRHRQTVRLLKWIDRYPGWWYLICTPKDENINLQIIKTLIEHLAKEQFYEIIFVLLMVHRDEECVKSAGQSLFMQMLITEWSTGHKDEILKKLLESFE